METEKVPDKLVRVNQSIFNEKDVSGIFQAVREIRVIRVRAKRNTQ